ncbi:MAG TPA: hypothetical protein PLO37_06595 [Candidatus Hydrogenedentes bacterium]|nr:hypothetical protein [Candidatus Hydrogenedentota bacterium]HPG66500.1 hypothetical protein [Candidatus Hydrogenedentota bacterium]
MRIREITPEPLKCIVGACPAVYETDRGTFILIGRQLDVAQLLPGKVGSEETAIEIPQELLTDFCRHGTR